MIRFLLSRIGCLMMFIGVIVLAVGIAAVQSDQPGLSFLALGAAGIFLGFLLWDRLRERTPRNKRSSLFRKRGRRREDDQNDRWEDRFHE